VSYAVGTYLPSENDLCKAYAITRTTARRALDELLREGFIEKEHGKGSRVKERRQSLGLLTVKGFSEAVGQNVFTTFLEKPKIVPNGPINCHFRRAKKERAADCIYFERLRGVGDIPCDARVQLVFIPRASGFLNTTFEEDSFFKTLSSKYLIEITGSEQELRALFADEKTARLLKIVQGAPVLADKCQILHEPSRPQYL
jgi:DNA-binding GntR family transcriptional regulator